jgi:hypothetical protein
MLAMCDPDHGKDIWSMSTSTRSLLAASFGSLGSGSAFFHGSGTQLGCRLDNAPIAHIALTSYQQAVSSLAPDEVVANVQPIEKMVNGSKNGTELINEFVNIFAEHNIFEWDQKVLDLNNFFQDDYKLTFAGIVVLNARMELPTRVGDLLLKFLCEAFGFDDYMTDFLLSDFDLRLQQLLKLKPELSQGDKRELLKRGLGVLLKIGYAMAWQEELFVGPWLPSSGANKIGAWLMPFVNALADKMTTYRHSLTVKTGLHVYPDCERCRSQEPHSKWHEESAVGLTDLVYLTDDIDALLRGGTLVDGTLVDGVQDGVNEEVFVGMVESFLAGPEADCMRKGFAKGGLECVADLWGISSTLVDSVAFCEAEGGDMDCLVASINEGGSLLVNKCRKDEFDAANFLSCANSVVGGKASLFAILEFLVTQ